METGEGGVRIQDLRGFVRRRRAIVVYVAGAIFLTSIFVAAVLPNEYVAEATVMVEPQTISDSLVEATQDRTDLGYRLNLMAMEILSRSRLSRVIDDFGLYQEESRELTREEVIELMRRRIQVVPVIPELEFNDDDDEEINTFQILFRARSPKTAADVTNRLANDFVQEHLRKRTQTSGDTAEFLEGELTRLAKQIQEVEDRIANVKAENIGSLPEEMAAKQDLVQRAYDRLREAERTRAAAESDEAFYRQQALAASTFTDPDEPQSPDKKLQELELLLGEYQARGLTSKHPDVISTKREIEQLRSSLAQQDGDVEASTPKSMAQRSAEAEAQRASQRAEAAAREAEEIRAQIQVSEQRIARAPRVAEQLEALYRQYKHLYASFQQYSAKRLEAGVAANMELQVKGERFRVLEGAVAPPSPTSPNRPVILVLGLLLGLATGGGLALVLEATDGSFHTPRQLASTLQLPVLAAIPDILLDGDRRARRRRHLRAALLSSALTVLVLAGSGVGYFWVNGTPGFVQKLLEGEPSGGAPGSVAEQG